MQEAPFTAPAAEGWTEKPVDYDLRGNGSRQQVRVEGSTATIVDESHRVLWRRTFEHPLTGHLVGRFAPEKAGLQLVLWGVKTRDRDVYNGGYCFSFAQGFDQPETVWEIEVDRNPQAPKLHKADMDQDGDDEVVLVTWYRVIVFDGVTGKAQMECENTAHRNYGYSRVMNVDDDPFPEVVILCDFVLHVDFIDNDGKRMWKPWEGQYDYSVARQEILRAPHDPVIDVDQDGRFEMVYNLFNIPADGKWRMIVRDVQTGEVELEAPGKYLIDVVDLDGDGVQELLCENVPLRQRTNFAELEIGRITDGRYQAIHKIARGRWQRLSQPLPGNSQSMAVDSHMAVARGDFDGDRRSELLVSFDSDNDNRAEELVAFGEDETGKFAVKWRLEPSEQTRFTVENVKDIDGDGRAECVVTWRQQTGQAEITGAEGKLLTRERLGGLFSTSIAVDLDGKPGSEIVTQKDQEEIIALRAPQAGETSLQEYWRTPGLGEPAMVGYAGPWRGPVAVDLDGDSRPELLFQDRAPNDCCRLVVKNADGSIRWTKTFDDFPFAAQESRLDRFHAGKFNDDPTLDIYLSLHNSGKSSGQSMALDGRTGEILWHRRAVSDLYPPGERQLFEPNNDRGCFPTKGIVVSDFNGDSYEDLLFLALDYICLINGRTGLALEPTPFLHSVLTDDWCAYCSPVYVDTNLDGQREVFTSAAFGAVGVFSLDWKRHWNIPSSYQTNPLSQETAVADYDGDSHLETIILEYTGDLVQYDLADGREEWRLPFGKEKITDQAAGDIDGDGFPDVLFCQNQELVAIRGRAVEAKERMLWRLALTAAGGPPILADVDGDQLLEIIVSTADGYVNVIGAMD